MSPERETNHERSVDQRFLYEAIRIGAESNNSLLLDYCQQYSNLLDLRLPDEFDVMYNAALSRLKWLDVPLANSNIKELSVEEALKTKILYTMGQINEVGNGELLTCYVAVPALNEENDIGKLIDSFKIQETDSPIVLLVGDNNSTDQTPRIVQEHGGNVLLVTQPGVGAVRQATLEHVLRDVPDPEKAIIVQTDADCEAMPGYLASVIKEFQRDTAIQVGIGPSVYSIPVENGEVLEIASGREYGELLGTSGLRAYFEALNRNPQDYLIEPPFRYLVGPNTAFRASLFLDTEIHYPTDGKWETLDLSIKVQQRIPSATSIYYINGQRMQVSPRAILNGDPYLTDTRLEELHSIGYVGMFKGDGVNRTPLDTVSEVVHEIDTQLYQLEPDQKIIGIVDEDDLETTEFTKVPALHAATKERLVGRVALIGQRFE